MNSLSTYAPTAAFVDELIQSGLRDLCFAPGSRSTPLALLFADRPNVRLHRHIDERSAGFYALGLAKASRRPVALLCTSGTAAANFFPSVVEAYYGQTPLIVLTADRPPEARGVGSPQTIDQIKMFGDHVKWFIEMPLPEARLDLVDHARAMARRAYVTAQEGPPGPVHLNFPFREPLLPEASPFANVSGPVAPPTRCEPQATSCETLPARHATSSATCEPSSTRFETPTPGIGPAIDACRPLAPLFAGARRGLIVCGPQEDPALGEAVALLAARLGYPILADPLSQVRCGTHSKELIIDAYDAFLRDEAFARAFAPEVVLRFGAPPTSKPLTQYLERHRGEQILFDPYLWRDPLHRATHVVRAGALAACKALDGILASLSLPQPTRSNEEWTRSWQRVNALARSACTGAMVSMDEPFEGSVFAHLAELLPAGATLYVGNSMPVRDLDTFFPALDRPIRFMANRGANGIDGVISSALGASAAAGGPLVLVIGDLSFLHDLGGLLAAKSHRSSATIVLINNDGGGIFSFLPQANRPEHFEELFGAPTGVSFEAVAGLFGISFWSATDWSHFRALVEASLTRPGVDIIEVKSERRANVEMHRRVWQAVSRAIQPAMSLGEPAR